MIDAMKHWMKALVLCGVALLGGHAFATPITGTDNALKVSYEQTKSIHPGFDWRRGGLSEEEAKSQPARFGIANFDGRQSDYFRYNELSIELFTTIQNARKSLLAGFIDTRVWRVSEPSALVLLLLGLLVLVIKRSLKPKKPKQP